MEMLQHQLLGGLARVWEVARDQLTINEGKAILIGPHVHSSEKNLRSGVARSKTPVVVFLGALLSPPNESVVANLGVSRHHEQILRLDIEVLKTISASHHFQRFGNFFHVAGE